MAPARNFRAERAAILGLAAAAAMIFLVSCGRSVPEGPEAAGDRLTLQYWEKWTGFEAEAMKEIVRRYNESQDKVYVNYLTSSQIDRKLLLATSGGNPPDVAGTFNSLLYAYAEMGALTPLDSLMKRDGISTDNYLPAIIGTCEYRGFHWGLPTAPAILALHYNKKLFREAGLDPEKPPRTIKELDEYAKKLTKKNEKGEIVQLGFSPVDPGWWNERWGYWFGGDLWDGEKKITADCPENIRAFEWLQSYPKTYGLEALQRFQSGSGQFASAQNHFIAGKIAMQLQGVWMTNFIEKYNPDMEWGAAPFPSDREELKDVAIVESDALVIPKGSHHAKEAWEFIKFTQRQENLELLALKQKKFSPLKKVSAEFYAKHSNPYIQVYRRLAESKNAKCAAKLSFSQEYNDEFGPAVDLIWRLQISPAEALKKITLRVQPKLDRARRQWDRVASERIRQWSQP